MTPLRQVLLSLTVLAAGAAGWAVWSADARPWLERVGLGSVSRAAVPEASAARQGAGGPLTVVAAPAAARATTDEIRAIGDGRAIRSVSLLPEVGGRVAAIRVTPGERVAAGAVILELDDAIERIALDRARILTADARTTADRVARLRASGTVSDLQETAATLALRTAELGEAEAEIDLARRRITAPIAGHVGLIAPEVGDQITTASEITRIDDRSAIIVEFRLPERFVGQVAEGDPLTATTLEAQAVALDGRVRAIDNRVDSASRSIRIQAEIANDTDRLRAGMAFSIQMSFPGPDRIAVPPLAVQWDADGAYAWVVRAEPGQALKAQRVGLRIVEREAGEVLVDGAIAPGESVVTEGVQSLRPGVAVVLAQDTTPTAAAASGAGPARRGSEL